MKGMRIFAIVPSDSSLKLLYMRFIATLLLAAMSLVAGDTWIQPYCVHQMKALGAPVLPQATDYLGVFATGVQRGVRYRVTLTYRVAEQPPISVTVDAESNEVGVFASFPVEEAAGVSIVGWSIRKS